MKLSMFEVLVLKHPTKKEHEDGAKTTQILFEQILANNDRAAYMKIARQLPEGVDEDTLEILIRTF